VEGGGIPSNVQSENKEIPEIYNQKKSRLQLLESKPFKHHDVIALHGSKARRRRTNRHHKQTKKGETKEEVGPSYFVP